MALVPDAFKSLQHESMVIKCFFFSSLQCFPEGTDMTSVLDLYFQVSVTLASSSIYTFLMRDIIRLFSCFIAELLPAIDFYPQE